MYSSRVDSHDEKTLQRQIIATGCNSQFHCHSLWNRTAHRFGDTPNKPSQGIAPVFDHFQMTSGVGFYFATVYPRSSDSVLLQHSADQIFDALALSPNLHVEKLSDHIHNCRHHFSGLFIRRDHQLNDQMQTSLVRQAWKMHQPDCFLHNDSVPTSRAFHDPFRPHC